MSACQGLLALDGHLLTLRTLLFLIYFEMYEWRLTSGTAVALRRQLTGWNICFVGISADTMMNYQHWLPPLCCPGKEQTDGSAHVRVWLQEILWRAGRSKGSVPQARHCTPLSGLAQQPRSLRSLGPFRCDFR